MKRNEIDIEEVSIDGDMIARAELMEINRGYASVPTLIFPDGTRLTEPGFRDIRRQLGLEKPSLISRLFGRKE
jgi:hypothetical protein